MKRTALHRKIGLRKEGTSDTAKIKKEIQALLRQNVIHRDGGCILRFYPETGACDQVLQAEHLNTRARAASFADLRLVVCLCRRHHIFWKPQHANQYYEIVKRHIGAERTALLEAVQADQRAHRMTHSDWQKEAAYLRAKLEAQHILMPHNHEDTSAELFVEIEPEL